MSPIPRVNMTKPQGHIGPRRFTLRGLPAPAAHLQRKGFSIPSFGLDRYVHERDIFSELGKPDDCQ